MPDNKKDVIKAPMPDGGTVKGQRIELEKRVSTLEGVTRILEQHVGETQAGLEEERKQRKEGVTRRKISIAISVVSLILAAIAIILVVFY